MLAYLGDEEIESLAQRPKSTAWTMLKAKNFEATAQISPIKAIDIPNNLTVSKLSGRSRQLDWH